MPTFGENQAFAVHVQDAHPHVAATRRRRRASALETTMVFRTAGESSTRVRAENASGIRISITGPKPGEETDGFEATAFGRSPYNLRTSVTITHHDVNLALDTRLRRPLVRFVSVGPISEADAALAPGEPPLPESCVEDKAKVKPRPVSAPPPSAALVKAMLDAPPTITRPEVIPARPTAPLRIITNPLSAQNGADPDSEVDSPLNSPSPVLSFRPHQFSGRPSMQPRRQVLNEPLPSLCPRSPSESSFVEYAIPEQVEEEAVDFSGSPSSESLENTLEGGVSLTNSIIQPDTGHSPRTSKVISLTKAVKSRLYAATSSRQTASTSTLAHARSSMTSPPSAFQRFERSLVAASGSSVSVSSRISLRTTNGNGGRSMKAFLGKLSKGMKRTREEEEENVDPGLEDAKGDNERPVAGRRIKRKLMGVI